MGILNLTPDSFYEPSRKPEIAQAIKHTGKMLAGGADIIDIGAESTRPGAIPVPWQTECQRLLPVLKEIRTVYPQAIISIDTRNARTAQACLELGASIINDVSACRHDSDMLKVLADFKPAYVLMHSRGSPRTMHNNPCYQNLIEEINIFFSENLKKLETAGLPQSHIVIDPGIGFGKTPQHNLEIIKNISKFKIHDRPLLMGISMKGFLNRIWGFSANEKIQASSVLSAFLFQHGCEWHRVHDVSSAAGALKIAESLYPVRHPSQIL